MGLALTNLMLTFSGKEGRVYQCYPFREGEQKYSEDFSKIVKLDPFLMVPGSTKMDDLHSPHCLKGHLFSWDPPHSSSGRVMYYSL